MPKGGKIPGSGRKPGSLNKATADVKAIARVYAPDAVKELARLSREATSETARVAAIKEILERAYGKSPHVVEGDGEVIGVIHTIKRIIVGRGGADI